MGMRGRGVIRRVLAAEVVPVRWPVLRQGLPRESAIFPGDDAAETQHLGMFVDGLLVCVASIYRAPLPEDPDLVDAWQLRGMATIPSAQRQGCGSALVRACIDAAEQAGAKILWCNARRPASAFYLRHGFEILGEEFDIPTAGPHYRMWRSVGAASRK